MVLLKKIFKLRKCISSILILSTPLKRISSFIWISLTQKCCVPSSVKFVPVVLLIVKILNLTPLQPSMLCLNFGCNWPNKSGNFYLNIAHVFFSYFSPWKMVWSFIWKKLESSPPKDDLYQVWFKLAVWFWRRRFLNTVFSLFYNYLPLEKSVALHLSITFLNSITLPPK